MGAARPKTGTTERQNPTHRPPEPPAPAAGRAHVDASPAPPEGAGGAIKILGCAAPNLLCAHTQPALRAYPTPFIPMPTLRPALFGTPGTGAEWSPEKKNTKPNLNRVFLRRAEWSVRHWGTLWAGRSAGMGMGCARAFFASQGWRAVLQDATPYPPPRCRASREGPGVRAILAAPLALKAGPGPLPPHARSNSGAGPPMASASPGGELATLPGVVLADGGPDHGRRVLRPRPVGAGCRRIFAMDGSCPDGPGHGAAFAPGYCRGARA